MAIKKWLSIFLILSLCLGLLVGCSDTPPETKAETDIKQNIETLSKSTKKINPDGTKNEGFYGLLVKPIQANINAADPIVKQIEELEADEVMHFTRRLRSLGENPERYNAASVSNPDSENSLEIRQIIDEAIAGSLKDIMGAAVYSSLTGETVLNGTTNYYSNGVLTDYALLHYSGCESGMTANIREAIWASGISWSLEPVDRSKQWTNTYIKDGRFMTTTKDGGLPSYHDYWVIARTAYDIVCSDGTTIPEGTDLTRILIYCGSPIAAKIDSDGLITVNPDASKLSAQAESPVEDFEYVIEDDEVTITKYTGEGGNVVIPSQIEGKDVTAIGDMAFYECVTLIVVVIPVTVVYIGEMAFYGCVNLYAVYFLQIEVIFISNGAFSGCDVLTIICIIETYVYYYCIEYEIYFEITEITWIEPSERQPQENIMTLQSETAETAAQSQEESIQSPGIGKTLQVSVGGQYTLAIQSDNSLWGWGSNIIGSLGIDDKKNQLKPIKIMDNVLQLSVNSQTAVIKSDNSLWVWGDTYEKTPIGNTGEYYASINYNSTPTKIMDDVVQISTGSNHTMAIKSDGSLWTWGSNEDGQLGDGTIAVYNLIPVKVMDNVVQAVGGFGHTLALKADGSLWAWGSNGRGQLGDGTTVMKKTPVKIMDNVTNIAAGSSNSAAIKTDGSLWAWGWGNGGVLPGDSTVYYDTPTKIMDDVKSVSIGLYFAAAVKNDGSLWTWGHNSYGELGDGSVNSRETSTKIMDNVAEISTGGCNAAAIKTDGSLWTWGLNTDGQLGDGTTANRHSPVMIWGS